MGFGSAVSVRGSCVEGPISGGGFFKKPAMLSAACLAIPMLARNLFLVTWGSRALILVSILRSRSANHYFHLRVFRRAYHFGIMQLIIRLAAWVMTRVMGASGAESLNIAASIFMGQTEAPVTIRPFYRILRARNS